MKRAAADGEEPPTTRQRATCLRLRHRYFVLRHGESEANVAGIITSDPEVGTKKYGLTAKGRAVTEASAENFATSVLGLPAAGEGRAAAGEGATQLPSVRIYASDFKRTRETSQIFAETLAKIFQDRAAPGAVRERDGETGKGGGLCPRVTRSLRERRFGELEEGPNTRYDEVWAEDIKDPNSTPFAAESAKAVQNRTAALIRSIEAETLACEDADGAALVVLVSHGDALQLMQTAFQGKNPAEHRSLKHLNPADLRELIAEGEGLELLGATA